jgi:methionine-rich copper-binding protein CopC
MRRLLISLVAILVIVVGVGSSVSPAFAHTSLIASDPADGANLGSFPRTISLEFSETLLTLGDERSNYFQVLNEQEVPVELEGLRVDGATMTANLVPVSVTEGRFQVRYRVVSSDGHVIRGSIYFTVSLSSPAASTKPVTEPSKSEDPFPSSQVALGTLIFLAIAAGFTIFKRSNRRDFRER